MNKFKWIGISESGEKVSGTCLFKHKKDLIKFLKQKNYTILSIKKKWFSKNFWTHLNESKIIKQVLLPEISLYLAAGLTITDALSLIEKNSDTIQTRTLANQLINAMHQGNSFSASLSLQTKNISAKYIQAIRLGENTDRLSKTLNTLNNQEQTMKKYRAQFSKIIFYPSILLIITILMTAGIILFVLPKFQSLYHSFHATIPSSTRSLLAVSAFINHHCMLSIITMMTTSLVIRLLLKIKIIKCTIIKLIRTKTPLVKSIWLNYAFSMWCCNTSDLMEAGYPFLESFKYANSQISHHELLLELTDIENKLSSGLLITQILRGYQWIPSDAQHMIRMGDSIDRLETIITQLSQITQTRLNEQLEYLSKVLEPVMMLLLSAIITALLIAIYLPIFQMGHII